VRRLYKKKEDGPWYGQYYENGQRIRVNTFCWDKRAADGKLRDIEREAHSKTGVPSNAPTQTIAEALHYLVEHGCSDCADATLGMYAQKGGHILRLLQDVDVNSLSLDQVQDFINTRLEEGAHRESVRKELCTLRRALALSHDRKLLRADARTLIPQFRTRYIPRDRFLTEAEFSGLLQALPTARRLWVLLAVFAGPRKSELEALRWEEHVDLDRGWLLLPGTKTKKSRRKVPIPDYLRTALAPEWKPSGPVVSPWLNGRRDLRAACQRIGIRPVSANDLRRTFASWLKQRGVDSMIVARLMGHTSSAMVEKVYGHLNNESLTGATNTLPRLEDLDPNSGDRTLHLGGTGSPPGDDLFREIPASYCAPGGARTPDLRIRSPTLYPVELRAQTNQGDQAGLNR